MKIRYLGTAAAEGIPALVCNCRICCQARQIGGREIRTRSQAIVDNFLLVDFPCDTYSHMLKYNYDLSKIRNCLITHGHRDHLYPDELECFYPPHSHLSDDAAPFNLYGSDNIGELISGVYRPEDRRLIFHCVQPFSPFNVGDKYTVTALKALHGAKNSLIYMISDGNKTILYAHDTGIFPDETWDYLKTVRPHFDFVSLDCTDGAKESMTYDTHMCLGRCRKCRDMLFEYGCADADTVFVLNHFSHNGLYVNFEEISKIAANENFIASYDGMEIEF